MQRINRARHHGLKGQHHLGGRHDGIDAVMRPRAVTAHAHDVDVEQIRHRHHGALRKSVVSHGHFRRTVSGIDFRHVPTGEESVVNHLFSSGPAFFTGLNDDHRRARKITGFRKRIRRRKRPRRVPVVPAGVHDARRFGSPFAARFFDEGKRVHVGSEQNRAAVIRAITADQGYHPGAAHAFGDFVTAEFAQCRRGQLRRFKFLQTHFRMRMDLMPNRHNFRQYGFDGRPDRLHIVFFIHHFTLPVLKRGSTAK